MSDQTQTENEAPIKLVATMDQLPTSDGVRAESPLHHAGLTELAGVAPFEGGVYLKEEALLGHLILRGNAADDAFKKGVKSVLGVDLPGKLQSQSNDRYRLCWISPDEWLLILPGADTFKVENDLRAALQGHYAIVNVSGGQTVLSLRGDHVIDVLKKSTPYDVHDRNFPVDKVITSVFAKSQAVIFRVSSNEWKLVIRRSFADYVWMWLQNAAGEYGLVVE